MDREQSYSFGDENKTESITNLEKRIKESIESKVLEGLYGSVQKFSSSHLILKDRPEAKLEFESKIVVRDFVEIFLPKINQNTKGTF